VARLIRAAEENGGRDVGTSAGVGSSWGYAALLAALAALPAAAQSVGPASGWSPNVAPTAPVARPSGRPNPALPPAAPARGAAEADAEAGDGGAQISVAGSRTRIVVVLTRETTPAAFLLADPWRVVADLADTDLARPVGAKAGGRGLVKSLRAGLFAPGKLRVVIDATGPVAIESARVLAATASSQPRLELVLVATSASATSVRAADIANAAQSFTFEPEPRDEAAKGSAPKSRPVVVIDAGHGGIDPGAHGEQAIEKEVVLAVALEVRRALAKRFEVVMTRTSDVFVSLDQRLDVSRRQNADLFLSLHADALEAKSQAQTVRGATVYTLGEKASDARAKAMAEKENAADLLAGLSATPGDGDDRVRDILVDLMRRESANFSGDFRKLLVGEMRPRLALARDPYRSAPFKVLRQAGTPAVLVELGYISNAADEKLMLSAQWQRSVAEAISNAIDAYFKRRRAEAR
jgi:N-acetylmuramoyl-L-alanine amidase